MLLLAVPGDAQPTCPNMRACLHKLEIDLRYTNSKQYKPECKLLEEKSTDLHTLHQSEQKFNVKWCVKDCNIRLE